jgi:predicted HicB family RNase H-like nuclease
VSKDKKTRKSAADKMNKKPKMFRLQPDTAQLLVKAAAKAGLSQSVYVEQTLRARFKKDGIEL